MTFVQAQTAYLDNAGYDGASGSVAMAKAFRTACRQLLALMPKLSQQGANNQLQLSPDLVRKELEACSAWLASHDDGSAGGAGASNVDGVAVPPSGPGVSILAPGGRT